MPKAPAKPPPKAAPKPPAPVEVTPVGSQRRFAHDYDADHILRWVQDVVGMLAATPPENDLSHLSAIAVRMSRHDRDQLLRILSSNAEGT